MSDTKSKSVEEIRHKIVAGTEKVCAALGPGKRLALVFAERPAEDFNRYEIKYSSSGHLGGILKYTVDGEKREEIFYLEKGENVTFRSFIATFLGGRCASEVISAELSCLDGSADFEFCGITFEKCEAPDENEIFIQNRRFRLGIRLKWGGGISYIEDLQSPDASITNLLNNHDTGRLVQQSYYGTDKAPYAPAKYGKNLWRYNPVQGGDQYGNRSRLIDYSVSGDGQSVCIKCIPADWAQNGVPSLSYMENRYTLNEKNIEVFNRFIDFSGYDNPVAHQELPAFYTISYLSEFHYYAGENAWENEPAAVLKNEPFWAEEPSCGHRLKCDETWGAWISPEGWGIGVYTPIATTLLAGRYCWNGTKSASDDPTNYIAPLISRAMTPFQPFEYSYYITTGTEDGIRGEFKTIREKE